EKYGGGACGGAGHGAKSLEMNSSVVIQRESLKAILVQQYIVIVTCYCTELEVVKNEYEKYKERPPLPRNMPPVSGNVAWARQLLRRIEVPMKYFREHPEILHMGDARKIVKSYNRLASALIEFELLWVSTWSAAVTDTRRELGVPVFVRHPTTKDLHCNFSRSAFQLLLETKHLMRMEIKVPEEASFILMRETKFKADYWSLGALVRDYNLLMRRQTSVVGALLAHHLADLDKDLAPGLTEVTWTSPKIQEFYEAIVASMSQKKELVSRIDDVLNNRINHVILRMIRNVKLSHFAFADVLRPTQFVERVQADCAVAAPIVENCSQSVEIAAQDLFRVSTSGYTMDQRIALRHKMEEIRRYLELRVFQSMSDCIKRSLTRLRRLVQGLPPMLDSERSALSGSEAFPPMFRVEVYLRTPDLVIVPSLEELEEHLQEAAVAILGSAEKFMRWGQPRPRGEQSADAEDGAPPLKPLQSYFDRLTANKGVVKEVLLLVGSISELREAVNSELTDLVEFQHLWMDSAAETYTNFMRLDPTIELFEERMNRLVDIEQRIMAVPDSIRCHCLEISMSHIKGVLQGKANEFKLLYANEFNRRTQEMVKSVMHVISEVGAALERTVDGLEDMRGVCETLSKLNESEPGVEMALPRIEDDYAFLRNYGVPIKAEEQEQLDQLPYQWRKLKLKALGVKEHLQLMQGDMKAAMVRDTQAFIADLEKFKNLYEERGPAAPGIKARTALERLREFQRGLEERERRAKVFHRGELLFNLPTTEYPELAHLRKELKYISTLYNLFQASTPSPLDLLDASPAVSSLELAARAGSRRVKEMAGSEWAQEVTHGDPTSYEATLWSTLDLDKFSAQITDFQREREEQEILEELEEMCSSAVKESEIEYKLEKIKGDWTYCTVSFANYKTKGKLLLDAKQMVTMQGDLEDSQMTLASLLTNRYNHSFKKELSEWYKRLSTVSEVLELWLTVQAMWHYLEVVFTGGDIAKQLPQETKRFAQINKAWSKMMHASAESPNLIRTCYSDASVQQTLPHLNQQLELCQKSLSGYLEMKRNLFPRFFFVSDPSILEILGQGSDPKTIQPHLGSVFDNVTRVTFHRITPGVIIAMSSAEGEEVPLKEQMVCEGNVEDWLAMLERAMIATLRSLMREASRAVRTTELQEFINRFPAQVAFFGLQLQWCQEMEGAMHASRTDKNSVKKADMRVAATLRELVVLSTRELPPMSRTTLETLITQQVHQKDVSQELLLSKVHSVNEFEWTKQTRVYWNSELDGCMLSITDVELEYAYEYIGVQERLVITPLTDRCYITLAKALGLFLGGAPAGPAGTGKTETTKDMGHCLGKFVVVFNCSDQFDHRGMGKIFKGLSQSGAWGCFDEFNRIELEVLSVVAQQLVLNPGCGFFITMNPGYAGRQELPENLKALFRSVAMMVPDRQRIMRVKLAAAGFQTNELFAKKFFVLYGLCEQQLSKQRHYDFGLRNILSVLRALGPALRAAPTQPETTIFLRVLRDMNLSKLSDEDEPLFLSLLNDLFPGEMVAKEKYAELTGAIDVVLEASTPRLVNHPEWNLKVIQLHETAMVRWGIMILGTSCAGKSTCVSTYLKARCHVGQRSTATRMNPKAVTASQMFGLLDAATNDWTDGIFAALWRKACKRQSEDATWLVLDGPVDAVWIENLNTVLDDNRMLTLANGDRIAMAASLKLLFEVANLDNASPATVSRAGIVYMSASSLGWRPVVQAWLQNRCDPRARPGSAPAPASPEVPLLKELFAQHVEPIFEFMHQEALESKMALERVNCIKTCLLLLQALLPASRDPREDDVLEGPAAAQPGVVAGGGSEGDAAEQKQERATFEEHVQRLFVLALAWGVGGLLEPEATMKLDAYFQGSAMSTPAVGAVARTIFEFIVTEEGLWEGWSSRVPAWSYPSQGAMVFSSILVPTVDNVRAAFLLEVVARQRASVLLVGPSGSAKTVTVKSYLAGLPGNHISKTLNFSSATTPLIFQRAVESLLEKRLGNAFGPSGGRRMSVFIDDLNLPAINKWGDQVTSESLRALMEDGGFYSLEKPGEFKHMEDLQFGSIEKIYGGIIAGHYTEERGFPHDVVKLARQLPKVTHTLWQKVRDNMLPTPAKFHYIFNLRDLSRIAQGLTMTDSEVVKSPGMLCRLWLHESSRVLSDKLNAQEDLGWFTYTIGSVLETVSSEATFLKSIQQQESVCFVDFLRDPPEDLPEDGELDDIPKVYELVPSWDELKARLTYYQRQYNESTRGTQLDLVLFQVAIHHLTRISRILRMPRGSALLVGVGGTGKQSLTRLAAFIAGYKLYQLNITREYKTMALFEDLKHMYREAATAREPIVFLCTDADILDESFLEYINMLQVSGEIPNLLAKDEVDAMLNDVRTIIQKDKELSKTFVDTRENLYGRMVERVRDNLHLVLCFSPVGERFRERAERFPGLISGCTMNWFFGWPMDALRSVGTKFLADFPMVCNTTVTDSLIAFQGHVHSTVRDMCAEYFRVYRRHAYVTPKSFLSFMKGYKTMYSRKKRELEDQAQTLRVLPPLLPSTPSTSQP
ncbi:hypothetical protein CYMTET_25536, partial [Cymbomonas tetramitiformis]